MQVPENPRDDETQESLSQLQQGLGQVREEVTRVREEVLQKIEQLDDKFDTYQKGTDGMVRRATTIFIATASVIVFSSLSPALTALATALSGSNN